MARAFWKGSISFGLVSIPVALVTGERSDDISFRQLDKRDLSPIGYERINKASGEKVEWGDIIRGYEHAKGSYVVITDADLKRANVDATQTVNITDFVPLEEIEPVYFVNPYYLVPEKRAEKAYALLRESLRKSGRVGIAKVVIRTREHLAALVPRGRVLALVMLRYAHELRSLAEIEAELPDEKNVTPTPKELEMAERLIEGMSGPFEPTQYRDEYRDDLMAMIEKKVEAGEAELIDDTEPEARAAKSNVVDLMSLLQQSVAQAKKGASASAKASKTAAAADADADADAPRRKAAKSKPLAKTRAEPRNARAAPAHPKKGAPRTSAKKSAPRAGRSAAA